MARYEDMMMLPTDKRQDFWRKAYSLELARAHSQGKYLWPIEKLPAISENSFQGLMKHSVPIGPAFDACMKFFEIPTQKKLFEFLSI